MTLTTEFLSDPKEFASRRVLLPDLGVAEPASLKAKPVRPNMTLYQVKGANRVLWATMTAHGNPAHLNRINVIFDEAQLSGDYFPVFWLPWKAGETYRIQLKTSDKHWVVDRNKRLASPHVFFTAALSGCTIKVDGDPYQPTVYHSNAQTHNVYVPPPVRHAAEQWQMLRKVKHMERQMELAEAAHSVGSRHYAPQTLDMSGYMGDALITGRPAGLKSAKAKTDSKIDPKSMDVEMGGTVFGIRSQTHGLWSFYYQSWTKFYYLKEDLPYFDWVVNRCERFWPGKDISKPIPIVFH